MVDSLPPLAILGAGSMGGAILRGVARSGIAPSLTVTNRTREKAATMELPGVASFALEADPHANVTAAAGADLILVGVKPAAVPDLLREIGPHLRDGAVVVSLAAGVTIAACEEILGSDSVVLRAMPNTPALVGRAVTGIAPGSHATAAHVGLVRRAFETVGTVLEVEEARIDALSTISGSGPAYVYLLIEELTRAAEAKGFSAGEARTMVEGTFIGASALLADSREDPEELRRRVTSPGGTTERAIAVLQDADLAGLFARATDAALARARELAAG